MSLFDLAERTNRRTQRMPVNPLDKCTLVSICPKAIHEVKPTIFPGRFDIPAVKDGDFEILVIEPSSWWKELEHNQPLLEIPTSSIKMAESVITDYCNGLVACNMNDRMPGLFFIPGAYNKTTIKLYKNENGETFDQLLEKANIKQKNWFLELVRLADIDWARTSGNPLSISDDSRLAAEKLGLTKVWMQDFKSVEMTNCKACGEMINPLYPICRHCKAVIDPIKAKELGLSFVA